MTAAEHLAYADMLLASIKNSDQGWDTLELTGRALEAIGHGLAAIAIELGAPHAAAPSGGGSGA